jgi:glycosyltransferase involved in cell wall biosynthesis
MTAPAAPPRVLRLTPAFDWRGLGGETGNAPFVGAGGVEVQARRMTLALAELGVAQTVFSLPPPAGPTEVQLGDDVVLRGVRGPGGVGPPAIARQLSWSRGVRAELRDRPPPADLVHIHSTCSPWTLRAGLATVSRLRVPMVITVHCSSTVTYSPSSRRDAAFQHYSRRLERAGLGRAARTLVLTRRVRERLIDAGLGAPERIEVMPDLVDVAGLREAATEAAGREFGERHGVPADRSVVLYLGRVAPEKGSRALIELSEVLAARDDVQLVVCGGAEDEAALRAAVAGRAVTVTGELAAEEVPAALARATVLVLPSTFEELGSVVLEAAAVGVPAVAFAVGGIPEVVRDGETGLLAPPGDVPALARALERLLDDPELAARLGAGAAARAGDYDLKAGAARLLDVYRTAAERG